MKITTLEPAFNWNDRRPIAALHLNDAWLPHKSPTNQAGWLFDPSIDVTTDAGLQDFYKRMMEYADQAILIMKDLNAQGMCLWELADGRYIDAYYMGSPDLAFALNPELNFGRHGLYGNVGGLLYDFLAKFKKAGMKTGTCLRPCEFSLETHKMEDSPDPYETLLRKAKYAHDWLGMQIFYVDTNTFHVADFPILPATIFARLHKALPRCLFIPEHEDIWYPTDYKYEDYYLYTAPYQDGRMEKLEVIPRVLKNIPKAFQCVNVSGADTKTPENRQKFIQSVKAGNILLIDGWWRNDQIQDVIEIYKAAQPPLASL